jgi:hypothetical protein
MLEDDEGGNEEEKNVLHQPLTQPTVGLLCYKPSIALSLYHTVAGQANIGLRCCSVLVLETCVTSSVFFSHHQPLINTHYDHNNSQDRVVSTLSLLLLFNTASMSAEQPDQAAPVVAAKGGKGGKGGKKPQAKKVTLDDFPLPAYVAARLAVWDRVKAEQSSANEHVPIKITLPDGNQKDGVSWETTPLDIATGISNGLAQSVVVAKV